MYKNTCCLITGLSETGSQKRENFENTTAVYTQHQNCDRCYYMTWEHIAYTTAVQCTPCNCMYDSGDMVIYYSCKVNPSLYVRQRSTKSGEVVTLWGNT